jgi:hypothetical protein
MGEVIFSIYYGGLTALLGLFTLWYLNRQFDSYVSTPKKEEEQT